MITQDIVLTVEWKWSKKHDVDSQLTYKTYESSIDMLKIKYPSHWIIMGENLSYKHVLKIYKPPILTVF